jgi:hypothetical protein
MSHGFRCAVEDKRCEAALSRDVIALTGHLSERLAFVHATGIPDNKLNILHKVAPGLIVYRAIKWTDRIIELNGAISVMHGVMVVDVTAAGGRKVLNNRAILLWEHRGVGWTLFYFQSTSIVVFVNKTMSEIKL